MWDLFWWDIYTVSTEMVESIHLRLREEIERRGLSLAAASRAAAEPSPQRLKDVVSGRQKCSADLVAKMSVIGIDALYVLTGVHAATQQVKLAPDEEVLLEGYRALDAAAKKRILAAILLGGIGSPEGRQSPESQTVLGSGNRVAGRDFNSKE